MPLVNKYFNEWNKLGFIDQSRIKVKKAIKRRNRTQTQSFTQSFWLYLMNFEPIYKYCAEKNIFFTEEEKKYLNLFFLSEHLRENILKEFPEEDIINATLKFYVKNFIIKYFNLLRDIRENPQKYKEEYKKAKELNNPRKKILKELKQHVEELINETSKKYNLPIEKEIEWDILKCVVFSSKLQENLNIFFMQYIEKLDTDHETVLSVDEKILTALNLESISI